MKGLTLAVVAFVFLLGACAMLLRLYRGRKYFKVFLAAFAMAVAAYAGLFRILPDDLGFLPPDWREPHRALDFLNGLLVLTLGFHAFWDVIYTTTLTGFSANLMVLLARASGLSRAEIFQIYGADEKLDRVLAWRLPSLLKGGYLEAYGAGFRLRWKGWMVGTMTRGLKRLLTGRDEGG